MKIAKAVRGACLAFVLALTFAFPGFAKAEELRLSQRTAEQFRLLQEHVSDANERMILANILLGSVPFLPLLRSRSPMTIVNILRSDFAELQDASRNLSSFFRGELRTFCQLEALHQNNSPVDREFWLDLADTFAGRMTFFPGAWENRIDQDSIVARFTYTNRRLNATFNGVFSGEAISFPITNIVIRDTKQLNLNMNSGGEIYRCDALIDDNKRAFTLSCVSPSGVAEVTRFIRTD